jgi:hypothetical protein
MEMEDAAEAALPPLLEEGAPEAEAMGALEAAAEARPADGEAPQWADHSDLSDDFGFGPEDEGLIDHLQRNKVGAGAQDEGEWGEESARSS